MMKIPSLSEEAGRELAYQGSDGGACHGLSPDARSGRGASERPPRIAARTDDRIIFYSGYSEPRWFEWNFATRSGARKLDERFAEVTGQALVWMASPSPPGFMGGDPQGTIFSRPLTTAQN